MRIPLIAIPLIVGIVIQLIKLIVDFFIEKKIKIEDLRRSWWFPSVHWWISTSLSTLFLFEFWWSSPEFTMAFIFSLLFWYDAMNIRYEAWQHAKQLNKINTKLKNILEISENYLTLKERLWHTLFEVIGWIIIWFVITTFLYFWLIS